jgi:chorismate mutase
MINKNILKIRRKLDILDNSFLDLIKKRSKLVDQVLKNKKFKRQIIDKKRISIILRDIDKKSRKRNIDPKITKKIWTSIIKAFIDYEFRNFKKK